VITEVFTLAVPVAVIITGLDPEIDQLVPEVPVCPDEEIVKLWLHDTFVKVNTISKNVILSLTYFLYFIDFKGCF
jgi:hypothetical protein